MLARFVRFGEFELDREAYQLRRRGAAAKMENLPFQLLMLLVARRGDIVRRREIEEHLWGKDVFVDVEQGINTAIRKIRLALRDHSERPRYLQTVVGRGYRFIATDVVESELPGTGASTSKEDEIKGTVTLEELGQAILAAAGLQYD
jgi:DNA-binding winged helix-turn-helix (wHTH) protein